MGWCTNHMTLGRKRENSWDSEGVSSQLRGRGWGGNEGGLHRGGGPRART